MTAAAAYQAGENSACCWYNRVSALGPAFSEVQTVPRMVLDLTGHDWTCGWKWVNCGGGSLASVTPERNPRDSLEDLSKGDNR